MASIKIHASAEQVWESITRPDLRPKWFFGVDTQTDWQPGSAIVHTGEWNGKSYTDKGTVKLVEPGRRLVHTHWSSMSGRPDRPENYETVSYTLEERDGWTDVEIEEANLANDEQRAASEEMWRNALGELKRVAEAEP